MTHPPNTLHPPTLNHPALHHRARGIILDYALGAAIVALLPIPYSIFLKIVALPVLLGMMVRGVLRLWRGHKPDAVAKLSLIASLAGALLLGIIAWFGGVALGARVPTLAGLAPGFAFFALFWAVGQALNHCYLSALTPENILPPTVDEDTPHEA